jgi:hypothetical protein
MHKYRYYKNKKSGKIYFLVAEGIVDYSKKEKVCIFADGNTGTTIMLPLVDFNKDFELTTI